MLGWHFVIFQSGFVTAYEEFEDLGIMLLADRF